MFVSGGEGRCAKIGSGRKTSEKWEGRKAGRKREGRKREGRRKGGKKNGKAVARCETELETERLQR